MPTRLNAYCAPALIFLAQAAAAFTPTYSFEISGGGNPVISGATNLPNGTLISAQVTRPGSYGNSAQSVVRTGRYSFGPFKKPTGDGQLGPGTYNVEVSTAASPQQPPQTRLVFGEKGENLVGRGVQTLPGDEGGALGHIYVAHGSFDIQSAAEPQAKQTAPPSSGSEVPYCEQLGYAYMTAFFRRNVGQTPQDVFAILNGDRRLTGLTVASKKKIANGVFFDPSLSQTATSNDNWTMGAAQQQVANTCEHPETAIRPVE